MAGFVILGVNLVVLLLNISVVALGLGSYISAIIPGASPVVAGLCCVVFTTLCAILNVRTNALITGAFLGLEMIALMVVTALGFLYPARSWVSLLAHPVFLNAAGHIAPATPAVIGLATSVAIFAFYGYGNAVYLGEETHDAPRHIARAVLWALVISVVSQTLPLAAALHGAPDFAAMLASDTMFGDFVTQRGGHALGVAINLSVALAIINADIAVVVLVSRMLFSTGRDGVWAGAVNRMLTLVHPRFGSPWAATLVTRALACLLCFVSLNLLLVMTGTTIVVVYSTLCVAVIAGRRNGNTAHAFYRMPFFPWPTVLALIVLLYVVYTNTNRPNG
jgi:amino acid transporter